jgi:hypothetical protein
MIPAAEGIEGRFDGFLQGRGHEFQSDNRT